VVTETNEANNYGVDEQGHGRTVSALPRGNGHHRDESLRVAVEGSTCRHVSGIWPEQILVGLDRSSNSLRLFDLRADDPGDILPILAIMASGNAPANMNIGHVNPDHSSCAASMPTARSRPHATPWAPTSSPDRARRFIFQHFIISCH
jgi:hypothetical protein